MSDRTQDWADFWEQPHSIYVNERHLDAHYRDIAEGIVALLPKPDARVLDHGCGEATHADHVAAAAASLLLCEAAASVRERLKARFADNPRIIVLSPDELEQRPAASLDLIIANSVVQYLSAAELDRLLTTWRRLLTPGGALIVADVIPPDVGPLSDTLALLRYAAKRGFLLAAMLGVIRTMFSSYRKVRATLGIACYSEAEFSARLSAHGYAAERLPFNLEHNPARMTFRARRREP
jgi:SAM-dependent methyltransferase